ncbi:MAG: MATE family efflux transporter, partial [Lachnospiraceae bacterium]|nr:MATE family efflux transporter [Lachnospiraceae bacterium]
LLFGASQDTLSMAREYTEIYLLGTVFVMLSLGMNSFINAQGQGALGMATVWIGAILNMVLDPLFIFKLDMGLKGAAIATVLSQMVSAAWTFYVLVLGGHVEIRLRKSYLSLKLDRVKSIVTLGMSGFIMSATNGLVQIVCNTTLQTYGGDVYVGAMTVIGSVRELVSMPVMGLTSSAQPVMGYNYGAKKYDRVREAIRFESVVSIVYTLVVWGILHQFPEPFVRIFNDSPELVKACVPAMKIYYFGFFMMALQFAGQTAFVALGKARQAVIFSILRKGVIVAPLTVLLPRISGIGIHGVFLAEPISNFIGGTACFVTMMITVYRKMSREEISAEKGQ